MLIAMNRPDISSFNSLKVTFYLKSKMGEKNVSIPRDIFTLAKIFPYYVRKISEFNFDYEIGSGGYGVVHHGTDSVSGKEVAIKQLKRERLKEALEQKYVQEVFATASCRSRFTVKLVGFTIEEPYSIIAEFQPKSTLNKILFHKDHISPKILTTVALGVSLGLAHMSSIGLIHRDIKASNILLNDDYLPCIADFGIAQFMNTGYWQPAGTPMYMAPEVFGNTGYDTSVDIFSFGMLLYEMSERHIAYNRYTKEELSHLAQNRNVYPEFSSRTPMELQNLIVRCWGLPDQRPTAEEIYNLIASGQVKFANFDIQKIPHIIQTLGRAQQEYNNQLAIQQTPHVNIEEEEKRIRRRRESNAAGVEPMVADRNAVNWPLIANVFDPNFIQNFKKQIPKIRTQHHERLFNLTSKVFAEGPPDLIENTLKCYRDLILQNIAFIDTCYYGQLIPRLPSQTDNQINISLDILALIFQFKPETVNQDLEQLLIYYVQMKPAEMILLASHYIKRINDSRSTTILDLLLRNSNVYMNIDSGYYFLCLFYDVIQTNPPYCNERMQYIRPVVAQFTKSTSSKTAAMAYRMLTHLKPQIDEINFVNVLEQLDDEVILPDLLKALLYAELPNSRRLCSKLIKIAKFSSTGFDIVCQFLSKSTSHMKTLAADPSWYVLDGLPLPDNLFQILLFLYTVPEPKEIVMTNPHFYTLLLRICRACSMQILGYLTSLIRRSNPCAKLFIELDKSGFLEVFFQRTAESGDDTAIYYSITLASNIATYCFVPSLIPEISRMKGFMASNGSLLPHIISLMSLFSQLKECRPHLTDLVPYFNQLMGYEDFAQLAATFLKNMKTV